MEQNLTLNALVRLHGELGGKIADNKREAGRLRSDMRQVEAVIHMLDPDYDCRKIAVRRRHNPNPLFKRGHVFRAALDLLREAPEPMTVDQICLALFRSKGVLEPTRDQARLLYGAVNTSLMKGTGKLVAAIEGRPRRWRVLP